MPLSWIVLFIERRLFPIIIVAIGAPAQVAKTRGKSRGCAQDESQASKTRYPMAKKRVSKRRKAQMPQKAAA